MLVHIFKLSHALLLYLSGSYWAAAELCHLKQKIMIHVIAPWATAYKFLLGSRDWKLYNAGRGPCLSQGKVVPCI